jgi:hypothetical protein
VEQDNLTKVELGPRAVHKRTAAIALLLVVVGAAFLVGKATRSGTRGAEATPPTTTAPSSSPTTIAVIPSNVVSTSGVAGVFAGRWEAHGLAMRVDPSGYGQIVFRTYTFCGDGPPPCDIIDEGEITNGGFADLSVAAQTADHATGQILTSTSPSQVPVGSIEMTYDATADILRLVLEGHEPLELCGPHASDPLSHCG